jgi:hypothetical protein
VGHHLFPVTYDGPATLISVCVLTRGLLFSVWNCLSSPSRVPIQFSPPFLRRHQYPGHSAQPSFPPPRLLPHRQDAAVLPCSAPLAQGRSAVCAALHRCETTENVHVPHLLFNWPVSTASPGFLQHGRVLRRRRSLLLARARSCVCAAPEIRPL